MSVRKYAGSMGRFVVICAILIWQLIINLRYRLFFVSARRKTGIRQPRIGGPQIARQTLEKLGPTFVKLGQFLSIRPDLVAPEYCEEFRKLQDKVPPFAFADARKELLQELKRDPSEVFAEFDETPVAAASVAQVYRARLVSGEEVAVKIRRPRVRHRMEEDILIMLFLAHIINMLVPGLRKNQLVMLVHEFARWTAHELDFGLEAKHALLIGHNLAHYRGVKIPKVFFDLSSERLLVLEFIHGVNALDAPEGAIDRKAVAHHVADSMLKQIFVDGFFHGDPHAGNILVVGKKTVAYVDFGIVGYLSEELRECTFDVLYAMSRGDVTRVIDSFLELCDVDADSVDIAAYRRRMNEALVELTICEIANIPFTHLMQEFLNISLKFGLDIPHDFVIMSKAIATLEGTCLSIDPELRIVEYLQPFVEKYIVSVPNWETLLQQLKAGPFELRKLKRLVLKHGVRALRVIERPTLRIESKEFQRITSELEKASVNVSGGLMIAALVVFSATIRHESYFESWLKTFFHLPAAPNLSIGSLVVAGALWLWLILRNRAIKKKIHSAD